MSDDVPEDIRTWDPSELVDDDEDPRDHSESRDGITVESWRQKMDEVGILPKYQDAHLASNCSIYRNLDGKQDAYAVLKRFSDRPGEDDESFGVRKGGKLHHSVVLTGPFGTGKTWLATAAFKRILYMLMTTAGRGASAIWRRFHSFVGEVQATYSPAAQETGEQVVSRFQNTDLLMLDEVGDLKKQDESRDRREMFYRVIDIRNASFLPTLITTNLSPDELSEQFGQRTFERIKEMSVFVKMEGQNLRDDPSATPEVA